MIFTSVYILTSDSFHEGRHRYVQLQSFCFRNNSTFSTALPVSAALCSGGRNGSQQGNDHGSVYDALAISGMSDYASPSGDLPDIPTLRPPIGAMTLRNLPAHL